ncbi:MAG TPA: hypothetical protein VGE90_03945 [Chitinophaga sp.]
MKHVLFIIALLAAFGVRAQNASLTEYTGKYNFGEGSSTSQALVELKGDKLEISSERGAASLTRLESDSFAVDEYGGYVAFRRSVTKQISGLKVVIPAASIDMEGVKADSAATTPPAKLTLNVQGAPFVRKDLVDLWAFIYNLFTMPYDIVRQYCVIKENNIS